MKLDVEQVRTIGKRVGEQAAGLEREIWELAGEEFTIGSPQQLGVILFEKLGLSKKRRGKTGFSTDARVLQAIRAEHPIIAKIEQWRELTKLKSTYLDAFPELLGADGRLRTTFSQVTAATGRLSSTNPNLQNIPIRTELGPRDPRLLRRRGRQPADLGRLLAGRAAAARARGRRGGAQGDLPPRRGRAHRDGRADPRRRPRRRAPARRPRWSTTGSSTGFRRYGLADRLQIPQDEAQAFIDAYLERFPAVKRVHRRDDRAGEGGGRRVDAVRADPARARDPRPQPPDAPARRAPRGEHGHPGDGRRHHQDRDDPRPGGARAPRASTRSSCCRSTTSSCSRRRTPRSSGPSAIIEREMAAAFEMDPPLEVDVAAGGNWMEAK